MSRERLLVVVSAPSGAGKTSLCERTAAELPDLVHAVSFTTRPPRPHERDGRDYYFVDQQTFQRMIDKGEFFEWAEVHGHLYGTARSELEKHLAEGKDVALDIDTQGAKQMKRIFPQGVFIFIVPPSLKMLEERLRRRKTDSEAEIRRRLKKALEEIRYYKEYQYVIVNDTFKRAVSEMKAIITAERCKSFRMDLSFLREGS
ncbi:MAG: guanylate kinase [candidate division NC10 bacterium]|nr:guanylate kinase [candidate division NC10 bacterium]